MADTGRPGFPGRGPSGGRRGRLHGRGLIDSVTYQPKNAAPRFAAIVRVDAGPLPGTRVRLVWMGQREVRGIEAGVELAFEGMASQVEGMLTVYNPRYEIIGRPEEP
ncbi:hypothetical protein ACX80W_11505 [Arthrobacter sp. TMN-37]